MRDVVLSTVDIPNRDAVAATFGRHDDVAVQLSGFVEVPADGEYTFYTESDDGSLLYIGDWLVLNNDGSHGMFEKGESLALKKGKHRLRLLYYQGHGDGGLKLSWSGPNVPKQIIPESALSHPE